MKLNMKLATLILPAFAAAATTKTSGMSVAGTKSGCYWQLPGVGAFNTNFNADWASVAVASLQGLTASLYTVNAGINPFARKFSAANIGIDPADGAITLTVPGAQTVGPISSAQLTTPYNDILYGSVRTNAKISSVAGTTHGFTFYSNDTQEIDLAFLTYDTSLVHLTNEQTSYSNPSTSYSVAAPSDATTTYHEYRVDWIPGQSMFYIDGVLVKNITSNIPTAAGLWLWNNWSNGNAWAKGPPLYDNVLKIRSIDAYFNRTSVASSIAADPSQCMVSTSSTATSTRTSTATLTTTTASAQQTSLSSRSTSSSVPTTSSSKASSSVASTSTSTTSTARSTTLTPATVSFTTVTTGYSGKVTTTSTVINGLRATVFVETPTTAKKGATSQSSTTVDFVTSTTDSGTATVVSTTTISATKSGGTGTVQIIYPTPPTSCSNVGVAFAAYSNKNPGGQATANYPDFPPAAYKTTTPLFSGTTTYIAESNDDSAFANVYGRANVNVTELVLDHTFYLFARQTGHYSFNIPYTDDIQLVWVGDKAVSGWTRANADIMQFWNPDIDTQTPQTLSYYLNLGDYVPVRVMWGNGGGAGDLQFNLYAPDGSLLLSSTAGQNAGTSSVDIVRFPCNSVYGSNFPVWGKET